MKRFFLHEGKKKEEGFTLLELLVVITIMMILATVSVGAFSSYRKVTTLIIAQESFASFLQEAKAKAFSGKNGKVDAAGKAQTVCFGLLLEKKNGVFALNAAEFPYDTKDVIVGSEYKRGTCKQDATSLSPADLGNGVQVVDATFEGSKAVTGPLSMMFEPVSGEFSILDAGNNPLMQAVPPKNIAVTLKGTADNTRTFYINLKSALISDEKTQ